MDSNFSREKLAFYETVVKTVGKSKGEEIDKEERKSREQRQYTNPHNKERKINNIYATVSAGGATLAIVGLVVPMVAERVAAHLHRLRRTLCAHPRHVTSPAFP